MVILSKDDLFQVKLASLIADYDRKTLIDLYMPIVGYSAISIYFYLWNEGEREELNFVNNHERLFLCLQMPTGHFIEERKKLEGLGLLKTYLKSENDVNFYTYVLYAPKTPSSFFNDALLYGLLIKTIGESNANKLHAMYSIDSKSIEGNDVSSSYASVFKPNFADSSFASALSVSGTLKDRHQGKIDSEFNFEKFLTAIKNNSQISENVFSKKILKEIERLSALYGIDEETMAVDIRDCYDFNRPIGEKIDFQQLTNMLQEEIKYPFLINQHRYRDDTDNLISSNTILAKKINLMETMSCKDYLSTRQNATQPVPADLKLIDDLSSKLNLNTAVINAIVDFVLQKNDNILARSYVQKVAASVAREKITTAYDTVNYLLKTDKKIKVKKKKVFFDDDEIENKDLKPKIEIKPFDEEEWKKILEEVEGGHNGTN